MAGVDHPFAIVPCLLLADVKPTSVVVYAVLAEHANADQECWPSVGRIARRANLTPATVRSATKELVERGWLTVNGRATDDGRQTSNLYKVRRIQHSDKAPQTTPGAPPKKRRGHPPENRGRTKPKEPNPLNEAVRKYSTPAETREMLDERKAKDTLNNLGDRVRTVRDGLRR